MVRVAPFELPDQNVSDAKKNEKWHAKHGTHMIHYITNEDYVGRIAEIAKMESLYIADPVKRETVTSPYGYEIGGDYEVYPLIESIIDDIIGRYLSRPLKRKMYSINKDALNSKLDTKLDYLMEDIIRETNKNVTEQSGVNIESPNPEIELPDDIEEFFSKSYKTNAEELGDDLITQFLDVNRYKDKIKYCLTEYLYGDTAAVYFDQKDGHPELIRARYDECYYDIDPEKEVQDDPKIFAFYKFYTENDIYNRFSLDRKTKKKVKEIFASMDQSGFNQDELSLDSFKGEFQNCKSGVSYKGWSETNKERRHRLRVLVMKWKSEREIRNLQYKDKRTGETVYKLLPQDYKVRDRDTVEVTTVETVHHVKMLGPELVLSYGELDERNSSIDNPSKASISAVGLIGKTHLKGVSIRSVAKKLEGLQVLASDILFQIKQIINSIDGKVLLYDAAQTPKQFIDSYGAENAINRVLTHMKKDKLVVINSKDKKDRNTFNQFSTYDLSNRGALADLTEGLMLVEDLARKFVGLTKEAQEGGDKYQTATGVNHSIIAANNRIETYFEPFDSFMGVFLTKYLTKAKYVYPEGKVFPMIFGDMQEKFLNINKDFLNTDLGMYIGDTAKDLRDKAIVDRGVEQLLSNAQDLTVITEAIKVLQKDTATESLGILERAISRLSEAEQEKAKAEQEAFDKKLEAEANEKAADREDKDKDRKNNLDVANIYANNKNYTEGEKMVSQQLMKQAELESKERIADKQSQKKETESKAKSEAS